VRDDGEIRHGCASARLTLDLFQELSLGKWEAINRLCDRFNHQTDNGRDMAAYNNLLSAAVRDISQKHSKTQISGLGLLGSGGFKLPKASASPTSVEDFELITWLAILPQE